MTPTTASANVISSAARFRTRPIAYWVATLVWGVEGIVGGTLALVSMGALRRSHRSAGVPHHPGYHVQPALPGDPGVVEAGVKPWMEGLNIARGLACIDVTR